MLHVIARLISFEHILEISIILLCVGLSGYEMLAVNERAFQTFKMRSPV